MKENFIVLVSYLLSVASFFSPIALVFGEWFGESELGDLLLGYFWFSGVGIILVSPITVLLLWLLFRWRKQGKLLVYSPDPAMFLAVSVVFQLVAVGMIVLFGIALGS